MTRKLSSQLQLEGPFYNFVQHTRPGVSTSAPGVSRPTGAA